MKKKVLFILVTLCLVLATVSTVFASGGIDEGVAEVDGVKHPTLQAAVDVADGKTVTVLTDVTLTYTLTINSGTTITLDLNGNTISQTKACTSSYSMIENKGNLTILDSSEEGTGKISFTDNGAGDATFGWGSYTLTNLGTLKVKSGTIENLSMHNQTSSKHMYSAIDQRAQTASTTIEGGLISTPTYRSIRICAGSLIISDGECDGQVWLQPNQGDATLTVTGGKFSPNTIDGSSIFMTNTGENYTVDSADISGGTFETKIGCSNPAALAGCISGGNFSESAVSGTNSALLNSSTEFAAPDFTGYSSIVPASGSVASIGNIGFTSLQAAINAAKDNDTVKLLASYENWKTIQVSRSITIDLNGFDIYRTFGGCALDIANGSVKVIGPGNISGSVDAVLVGYRASLTLDEGVTIEARDGHGVVNNGALTLDGATIEATEYGIVLYSDSDGNWAASLEMLGGSVSGQYGIATYADTTVTIKGGTVTGTVAALSGEGGSHGTTFTIEGGTIQSDEGVGIYHPQNGILNISGGTIKGATGINIKSGKMTVTGGEIIGTGEDADYDFVGGGFNVTGDALAVESCGYPGGAPVISIQGGTFKSENADSVSSYTGNGVTETVTDFIIGGEYFDESAKNYLAEGFTLDSYVNNNGDTVYSVEPAFEITFNAGNGTGEMPSVNGIIAGDYTLPECNFTAPVGKHFKAWNIDGYEYNAGESVDISGDTSVTAVWEDCNLKLIDRVEPTCLRPGKQSYYKCIDCGNYYEDSLGETAISDISSWGKLNKLKHIFTDATCTEPKTCTSCGRTSGATNSHTASEWKSNEDNHWKECSVEGCGIIIDNTKAAHEDSNFDGKCDTCEYSMASKPGSPDTSDNSSLVLFFAVMLASGTLYTILLVINKRFRINTKL